MTGLHYKLPVCVTSSVVTFILDHSLTDLMQTRQTTYQNTDEVQECTKWKEMLVRE